MSELYQSLSHSRWGYPLKAGHCVTKGFGLLNPEPPGTGFPTL
jgi:hypothetical protein